MIEKVKAWWDELDVEVTINKRELFLGVLACVLAGILLGIFSSPKKITMIGSNNGNNNITNPKQEPEEQE